MAYDHKGLGPTARGRPGLPLSNSKSWSLHEKQHTMCALVVERAEYRQRIDRERHAKHKGVK